jgi:hypothetical protein
MRQVNELDRHKLKIVTKAAHILALAIMFSLILTILTPARVFVMLLSLSFIGIPLSIISMFSKERLSKRLFALAGNLLPAGVFFMLCWLNALMSFSNLHHKKRTAPSAVLLNALQCLF